MSDPTPPPMHETTAHEQTARLLRSNELLTAEVRRLRQENASLTAKLAEARLGSRADKASRRAALNLMEDAVAARLAALRENQERQRAEEELREADRRKDEFLAMLAHELRNPLTPIRASLHILRVAGPERCEAEELFRIIDRQLLHLIRLVDDLMEVSRISRGLMEIRKDAITLADVVQAAVETCRGILEARKHHLTVRLPPEPLGLHADQVRLTQVLTNLLNNAARYTEEHGQIWLTASREGSNVVVSVRDTGNGIPTHMLSKVFDLFTQVDRTIDRAKGGLGIGLTLVRRLVDLHGGSVEAHSAGLGQGSEFLVRLPLALEQLGLHRPPPGEVPARRVLVVDDNRESASRLRLLLEHLGHEVRVATEGPAALDLLRTWQPGLALLDLAMPGMDGYEVARRARLLPEGQALALVALTGWDGDEERHRCQEAGFDHHLGKPVELGALRRFLEALPEGPAAFGRAEA